MLLSDEFRQISYRQYIYNNVFIFQPLREQAHCPQIITKLVSVLSTLTYLW
jgi:hypothetical protein